MGKINCFDQFLELYSTPYVHLHTVTVGSGFASTLTVWKIWFSCVFITYFRLHTVPVCFILYLCSLFDTFGFVLFILNTTWLMKTYPPSMAPQ